MAKDWKKGVNCGLARDVSSNGIDFKAGDKAWIFDVTAENVTLLTKTSKDIDPARSLKKIVIPVGNAEDTIKLSTGKPRKDFSSIFVTKEDMEKMAADKLA